MSVQLQVLNKIIKNKDYSLISMNGLGDKYFYSYKNEFNYIKNHYDTYKVIPDMATIKDIFPYFEELEVHEPDTYLLEQLFSDYNRALLANVFNKIKPMLENSKTEDAIDFTMKAMEELQTGKVITCTDLLKDLSRYDRYLERTADTEKYYLKTGFDELDNLTGGIDRENENMVIIARPGVGKTQILIKMATAAAQAGLNVGIYEGEMTVDKIGYRADTFLGNIQNTSLNRGDGYVQKAYKKYLDSLAYCNYGSLKVITQENVPGGEVTVDTLRAFIQREHLDILFVDQYSLLEDSHYARTEAERIGNIAKDIKKLQVETHIPIISVSQMNRQKNDDNSQDTTQVAGSDKIPQYATTVIALEQSISMDGDRKSIDLTLNIIKARDGGDHNKIIYHVDFNNGVFTHIPALGDGSTDEDDAEELSASYRV